MPETSTEETSLTNHNSIYKKIGLVVGAFVYAFLVMHFWNGATSSNMHVTYRQSGAFVVTTWLMFHVMGHGFASGVVARIKNTSMLVRESDHDD